MNELRAFMRKDGRPSAKMRLIICGSTRKPRTFTRTSCLVPRSMASAKTVDTA